MTHDLRPESARPADTPASARAMFCIHSYAGEAGPACGWRGIEAEATRDAAGHARCPRCRRATLLFLPPLPPSVG